MKTLKEYLWWHRKSLKDFCESIGYSRCHISGIMHGRIKPSIALAKYIEMITNGEVKADQLLNGANEDNGK